MKVTRHLLFLLSVALPSPCFAVECELYVAESTIPNAGLGVFSAVKKDIGDTVGNGDVCFPLMELDWHNGWAIDGTPYRNPFDNYVWDGVTMGMGKEIGNGGDLIALWPGIDCVINCLIPLENVARAFPKHTSHGDHLPYMLHRARDPGSGAITAYRSGETYVTRYVPAGGELFKNYGDNWFASRPDHFEGLPLTDDFPLAQELLEQYSRMNFVPLYNLLLDIKRVWSVSRTLNVLPDTVDEANIALRSEISALYQPNATRSIEWLEENGKCIDHIIAKPSTITGAGEGAFAKRNLPKGTLITGTPVLSIPNDRFLDIFDFRKDNQTGAWSKSALITKQVVYNYCLGHDESSLLLFPYGAVGVNYLNHDPLKANVRMQWAEDGMSSHNSSWLDLRPEEMENIWSANLGIDYIATKDIREGDELFIDYGDSWARSWHRHIETWKPHTYNTTAADWNSRNEPVRTMDERVTNPYPKNIEVRCHVNLLQPNWEELDQRWNRYDRGNEEYQYVYGVPCDVLERSFENDFYTVELSEDHLTFLDVENNFYSDDGRLFRSRVPRESMFFLDREYESDLYLENSFRHFIGIPEHMMPRAWRNRPLKEKTDKV